MGTMHDSFPFSVAIVHTYYIYRVKMGRILAPWSNFKI